MLTVEFQSRDQHLADYYQRCFGDWFAKEATDLWEWMKKQGTIANFHVEINKLRTELWQPRMLCEAKLQEHHDYITDAQGHRKIIRDESDQPKFIIPKVIVRADDPPGKHLSLV